MVTVIIRDAAGKELIAFEANAEETILDQATNNNIEIPYACKAGACLSCIATITKGKEHVMQESHGKKLVDTEENQCLTCIAGVKKESVLSKEKHIIDIEVVM